MNKLFSFIDLYSKYRGTGDRAQAASDTELAGWRVLSVYIFGVLGILAGPFIKGALSEDYPGVAEFLGSPAKVLWALFLGLIILVIVFRTLITPKTHLLIQWGSAIAAGVAAERILLPGIDRLAGMVAG